MQPQEPATNALSSSHRRVPFWLVLASGLLASLLATGAGEFTYALIRPDLQYPANFDTLSSSEQAAVRGQVRFKARTADETKKAVAAFGLLGVALGAVLGLVGGWVGGSKGYGRLGAVAGGVWGGAAGAGLSKVLVPLSLEASDLQTGVLFMLLTHAAIFGGVGAAAAWALAWGSGERSLTIRCIIGGLVGALLGTIVADVINLIAFPLLRMYEPVPVKLLPRFLLNLCVAMAVSVGAGLAAGKRKVSANESASAQ